MQVVDAVYQRQPARFGEFGAVHGRCIVRRPELHQRGAQRADRRVLVGVVSQRHDDGCRDAEQLAGIGHPLAVIARACANDAACTLGVAERGDRRQAVAHLEGLHRQVVLVLDVHLNAMPHEFVEQRVPPQGRGTEVGTQPLARREHVVEADGPGGSHPGNLATIGIGRRGRHIRRVPQARLP